MKTLLEKREGDLSLVIVGDGADAVLHVSRNGVEISTMRGSREGIEKVVRERFAEVPVRRVAKTMLGEVPA